MENLIAQVLDQLNAIFLLILGCSIGIMIIIGVCANDICKEIRKGREK